MVSWGPLEMDLVAVATVYFNLALDTHRQPLTTNGFEPVQGARVYTRA